jgi:tetratricopeptide (TPR) repeat protein
VLKPDKREGHRQAALWLQARSQGREVEVASQIAEHFDRAGIADQAMHYWLLAAEDASRRQSDSAAQAHTDRALALDDGTDLHRQVRLHRVRANVAERSGNAAATAIETTILGNLADRLDDDVLRLEVAKHVMWRCILDTHFEDAVTLGEQRLAQATGRSPVDAGRVHNAMFIALSRLGRYDEALAHAHKGLVCAQAAGDLITEGAIYNNLGVNHLNASRDLLAQADLQRALMAYNEAGSRHGAITVQVNLAEAEVHLGRFEQARDMQLRTLQDCQDIGPRGMEAMARANLSQVLCELGDFSGALDNAQQGLSMAQGTGDRWAQAFAHGGAHRAAYALGLLPEALQHARAACIAFSEHGEQEEAWSQWSAAACTLHAMGDPVAALAEAEAVLADVAAQGGWRQSIDGPTYLHRVLASQGDSRANDLLATASQNLEALADLYSELVPREGFLRATAVRRELGDALAAARAVLSQ